MECPSVGGGGGDGEWREDESRYLIFDCGLVFFIGELRLLDR